MKVFYMTKQFSKLAEKAHISHSSLIQAAHEVIAGKYEASLGGLVFKKRIAIPGKGKSGSTRNIIITNLQNILFFVDCYKKSHKDSSTEYEEVLFKKLADYLMSLNPQQREFAVKEKKLEVLYEEE